MKRRIYTSQVVYAFVLLLLLNGCRKDENIVPPTITPVTPGASGPVKGFYLLNEANMGSNKASLDYFDYEAVGIIKISILH